MLPAAILQCTRADSTRTGPGCRKGFAADSKYNQQFVFK